MSKLNDKIIDRLYADYQFKKSDEWMRQGRCPDCGQKSLWTHAHNPRVVRCSRLNKCGFEIHIKELYADLFQDWSATYRKTETNPNASADAYLSEGRGLNINKIKGCYSQDNYYDSRTKQGSATVRFELPNNGHWERLIDRPNRFARKANLKFGYKVGGYMWQHPANTKLTKELWLVEGIFDACALAEHGLDTASPISCSNFPKHSLYELKRSYDQQKHHLPTLVFAYDNDPAGKRYTKKHIKLAEQMGFTCKAAQPPYNKNRKLDWNDLHEMGRLEKQDIDKYRYYGNLLMAKSAIDCAIIMYMHGIGSSFYFTYNHRTYWFELDTKELSKLTEVNPHQIGDYLEKIRESNAIDDQLPDFIKQTSKVSEICNAQLEALYFQRNEITDESWYYMRISTAKGDKQITITGDQLSSPGKFKPRLLSVYAGVFWTGSAGQLDIIMRQQTEGLKEVQTTDFIGYAKDYQAYIFNDTAIANGKIIKINEQDYYKIGRNEVKSLTNDPILQLNTQDTPDFSWWQNFNIVRGDYGTIILAWWLGSYFAEQIRGIDRSYPFFELVGQAGAGKSRLLEFLWRLSGREDYEGFDPSKSTKVGVYRNFAQVSNLPVALIEGDRNDEDGKKSYSAFEWDQLKDAFNGRSIRSMGVKNNGNDTYSPPFRASIMISQNEPIQASEAMLTRLLHIRLTRDGQTLETKELVDKLDRLPIELTSRFMVHALKNEQTILQTYQQKVKQYEQAYHQRGITHTRVALNHAQIEALIDCLQMHVLTEVMTEAQASHAKTTLHTMAEERIKRLSSDHPAVEQFWEVYEYINSLSIPNRYDYEMNHYPISKNRNRIAINLNEIYRAAASKNQQLADISEMKRLLKGSRKYKFIEANKAVNSVHNKKTVKCWIFETPQ